MFLFICDTGNIFSRRRKITIGKLALGGLYSILNFQNNSLYYYINFSDGEARFLES